MVSKCPWAAEIYYKVLDFNGVEEGARSKEKRLTRPLLQDSRNARKRSISSSWFLFPSTTSAESPDSMYGQGDCAPDGPLFFLGAPFPLAFALYKVSRFLDTLSHGPRTFQLPPAVLPPCHSMLRDRGKLWPGPCRSPFVEGNTMPQLDL
jgi:hypothetical protein